MQTVSSSFTANTMAATQYVDYGVLISWLETINSSYEFFTIGTSIIGGPDVIKGTGNEATFLDRYQYTDYTDYALSINISKDIGQYPYGTIMAQCEVKLDNTSLLFMPDYDATIGKYILPNRPIKLSTGFSNEMIQMFAGYTGAPINTIKTRETVLTGFDGMAYLNMFVSQGQGPLAQQNNGVYINVLASDIIQDLVTEAGFATNQFVIEQSLQQPIGYFSPIKFEGGTNTSGNMGSVGYIISAFCEAEMGIAFFDENGVFNFWNRQHIPDNTAVQWTFDYTETAGGNNTGLIGFSMENSTILNNVQVQSSPRAVAEKQQVWQLSSAVLVPANSTYVVASDFTDSSGNMPVTELDTAVLYDGTNGNTSNFSVNLNADGSSLEDVGSYITVQSSVLLGSTANITFKNTYSLPIYITQISLYGTPAKVTHVINEIYTDPTSIALYGINPSNNGQPLVIQNDLVQDPETAYSIGYQLVTDYSTPLQQVSSEVMAVPQLQFGDFVQVVINDTNQTLDYTVQGITFSQTKSDPFKQTLSLAVKQMVTYFTIGVSVIGGTDQIAP